MTRLLSPGPLRCSGFGCQEVELERKARMAAVTDAELVRRDSEARVSSLQGEPRRPTCALVADSLRCRNLSIGGR